MKKVLSVVLVLVLLLTLGTVTVSAEKTEDTADMQELNVSDVAGENGYYQYDSETGEAVFVSSTDFGDILAGPVPDTITDEVSAITPYSVIGTDSRTKVTNPTGQYASTCLLGARFGPNDSDVFIGTGWLINNSYVATAGHMLFDSNYLNNGNGGYAQHVAVYVGASGGTYKQYRLGHWNSIGGDYVKNSAESSTYLSTGIFDDWGTIKLDSAVTAGVGWLGRYPVSSASDMMGGRTYYTQGYPGDRNSGISPWSNFYMYTTSGKITGNRQRALSDVYTDLDTYSGQSGSAIYSYRDGIGYAAEAIHIYGESTKNTAILLTPWLANHFNNLS